MLMMAVEFIWRISDMSMLKEAATLFRLGARRAPCSGGKMDVVQTRQGPELKMFINNEEIVLTIEKSATN